MTALIAADLDGTLLGPNGNVPVEALGLLSSAIVRSGAQFCLATSRSVHNVRRLPLGPDWLVAHDGACVLHRDRERLATVCERMLGHPETTTLVTLMEDQAAAGEGTLVAALFYGAKRAYEVEACGAPAPLLSIRNGFAALLDDGRRLRWNQEGLVASDSARSVSLFGRSASIREARGKLVHLGGAEFHEYEETRTRSGFSWLDAQAPGVDKGTAVNAIAQVNGLDPVVATGNGANDVGMLAEASLAIVPADACQEAKEVATVVLDEPSADGRFTNAFARRLPEFLSLAGR